MNLNQLKVFYLTAKLGSLSAAAQKLNVTQPAVTKGIQRLQEHYDIKFINRFGKKMILTDAGENLLQMAEKIFELEKQTEAGIRDYQIKKRGHIRILASESFGAYYLPHIIMPFSKKYPTIRVSANILPTEQVAEETADFKTDLGFISYPVENGKLAIRSIITDQLVIIVPPDHAFADKKRVHAPDLMGQSIISHEKGSATERALQHLIRENNLSLFVRLEFSSNQAIKLAVQNGIGVALISRNIAAYEIEKGLLKAISLADLSLTHEYYLVHHKDKYISEMLQCLIDIVENWASQYTANLP